MAYTRGIRDGSGVKSTGCSCWGPGFSSQHPNTWWLTTAYNSGYTGSGTPFWNHEQQTYMSYTYIHTGKTHRHRVKIIINEIHCPVVFSYIKLCVISEWARHIELLLEALETALVLPALGELVFLYHVFSCWSHFISHWNFCSFFKIPTRI